MNDCKPGNLEYGPLENALNVHCTNDRDELKKCYDLMMKSVKQRVQLAVTGQLGASESASFEMARKCLEPAVNFCAAFPNNCMSIGK
ncbi:hypothetical protein NPIL_646801 [Nephila pilipes]|uniref:Uncharacterized protein n=1 Tax=Nephila pilipes TaxID=299642 RepID=A0A8X6T3F2_NEPPI|nr:hypothetical protein NPIL_646801 [Nephila pilipes]